MYSGGATVVDVNLERVKSVKDIPAGLTHFFTEKCFEGASLDIIANRHIHCITSDYMSDFLLTVSLCLLPDECEEGHLFPSLLH